MIFFKNHRRAEQKKRYKNEKALNTSEKAGLQNEITVVGRDSSKGSVSAGQNIGVTPGAFKRAEVLQKQLISTL